MSISDDHYNARFPGERMRPVGDSRVFTETDDGDVIVDPGLSLDKLQEDGPVLTEAEFGETPVGVSPGINETNLTREASLGETLVGFANFSDVTMLADDVEPEENKPRIVNMVTGEGDVVPIDPNTLDTFDLQPQEFEESIVDALTKEEQRQFEAIQANIKRLQLLNGGMSSVLRDRLSIDPNYSGAPIELVHRARLSMLRLVAEISWLQNVLANSHPHNEEVIQLVHEISANVTPDDIVRLQRLFIGGSTGENARAEILSHKVGVAASRRGLVSPETTNGVCILGPKGSQLISLIEEAEPQD